MNAVIYARYSTDKQSDASIEDQVRECRATASRAGIVVVGVFEDRGISAGTTARPGYQAMLAAARRGEFDIICAEDVSRLWRSNAEFGPRAAELSDLGVHLVTAVGDDTRLDGWGMMIGIKQLMAEHARREISYRTRRGLEGKALAGGSTGGRCYGYTAAGEPIPAEAAVVLRIFALRGAGASQQAIANQLTYEGIPAPKGGRWNQSTVSTLLANQRYTGAVIWGKEEVRTSAADSRRKTHRMRSGGPLVERQDEARRIVPSEMWTASRKIA